MIKNRTPEGDLSGSVVALDPVNQLGFSTIDGGGGSANQDLNEYVYATTTLTSTESVNKGFIQRVNPADRNNNGTTIRIREDDINGAIIASSGFGAGNGNFTLSLSTIITNQSIGSRNYVFTIDQAGNPGDFVRLHAGASSLAYIVDVDDTHAGSAKPLNNVILG